MCVCVYIYIFIYIYIYISRDNKTHVNCCTKIETLIISTITIILFQPAIGKTFRLTHTETLIKIKYLDWGQSAIINIITFETT